MSEFSDKLLERLMKLVIEILNLESQMNKTYTGRHIYGQLFRSSTSAGANYEEARAGESSADFIHKMQIVLKELNESVYWLSIIKHAKLVTGGEEILSALSESKELANIIAKCIFTAKSKIKQTNLKIT
jgi:four helix bundle protein